MVQKKHKYLVTAVIPVYNSAAYISETLESVLDQSVPFVEVIVVNGNSKDDTAHIAKQFKGVKLVQLDYEPERIVKRNIATKIAKGNVLAFIDSDLVLSKHWLKEILRGFEQGYIAAVDRRAVYKPRTYIAKMNDHFFDLRFTDDYRPFTAWVVTKDFLQNSGHLDESVIGFEDKDLGDAIYASGHAIYFAKHAFAYHNGEPTTVAAELRRHFWFGSRALPYWKKHKPFDKPFKVGLFFFLTALFFVKPLIFSGLFALLYAYVFAKDLFYWKMHIKYLFVHPFLAVLSEFAYAYGFIYCLLRGPARYVRISDQKADQY
ncbi:glycosyltransferase family 2 protein [Candidatus Woesearchaeota archaeon]|nr:glycosyltransferase family 2 protein [Candidatus Woesearchaeota archaeon]